MDTYYYSNSTTVNVMNKSYNSFANTLQIGEKFYFTYPNAISLSAKMWSSETYYDTSIRLLYAWGKDANGNISQPKDAAAVLNLNYAVSGDNTIKG